MAARYALRLQFGWHQDIERIINRWVPLCRTACVDEVILFFFAEEWNNGHDTLEEIDHWLRFCAPLVAALRAAGVGVSLNPWHSLLHVDRGRTLKGSQQHWQSMIDPEGHAAQAVVCPLDPDWRAYYRATLDRYARADFDVIWIDDDIRLHNHGDLSWGGCFCPLHLKAFSAVVGREVSREELVTNCTAPGPPHPWREMWMDLWDAQQTALIAEWRACVEAHGKRLGLMTSLPEEHAAEGRRWKNWWSALGGDGVLQRPHFWPYEEINGSQLPETIHIMDQNRSLQPPGIIAQPEIENVPYTAWNKSLRQTALQMAVAQMFGASQLQLSLYDHMGNEPDDDPAREAMLTGWRPALDQLSEWFPPSLRTEGIGVPWTEDAGRCVHTAAGGAWQDLVCAGRGWARWLGAAGLATAVRDDAAVTALGGSVVHAFSDAQIKAWLQRGVLLDGPAARILVERGFADQIGLSATDEISQCDRPYAVEVCVHPDFNPRVDATISVNSEFFTPYGQRLIQGKMSPGAFLITELRGPRYEPMGHGLVGFVNEWGGRVVIAPWSVDTPCHMNTLRAAQLERVAHFLNGDEPCIHVEGGAWLVPVALTDGERFRLIIINGGGDPVSSLHITVPSHWPKPDFAVQLDGEGSFTPFTPCDGFSPLSKPMESWTCCIVGTRNLIEKPVFVA